MNIIELFENLTIGKSTILNISFEEIIRIEKHINVERKINPDIDVNVANNLIEALKSFPTEFQFIANVRVLYNFFSKKNYVRDDFPVQNIEVNKDKVKLFVERYLQDDLTTFFDKKIIENNYEAMNDLLVYKEYFPEELLYKVSKRAEGKVDYVLSSLNARDVNYFPLLFLKQSHFFTFLSHFVSSEMDLKINHLLNEIVDIYNVTKSSQFAEGIMISMSHYQSFDDELMDTIASNKRVVLGNIDGREEKSDKSGFSWKTFGIILVILIKIALFSNRCDSNSSYDNYKNNTTFENLNIEEAPPVEMDRYYTESQAKIDTFRLFLTNYDPKNKINVTYNDSIKTGQNPFTTVYKNQFVSTSSNYLMFTNKTNYDIILMENSVAFDTINMPKQAYYIKSKEFFKLDVTSDFKRTFNFYVGKKLASFHNEKEKLYIHGNSIVEPRFTQLANGAKELIKQDYIFNNEVIIKEKKGNIIIESLGSSIKDESFKEMLKGQQLIIEGLKKENE
ncbi:hypothetical protein [Flavobacterium sp.]|uniref:hypothetical protein n=1 Tax=Flavobacterium sp. TaxID=239 RepID=UPI0026119523|nr:hypothetical protein [Flavobacterium sp.]